MQGGIVNGRPPSALIADDEPLLRQSLARLLGKAWPELEITALARNGREAVEQFESRQPDMCFLDVHMPGLSGVEAARFIGSRAHLVFVTAFDAYAVQAFEFGALDYLVKPVEAERLAGTVTRLKERLSSRLPISESDVLLDQLVSRLGKDLPPAPLRWIRASVGSTLRIIAVDEIDYLRSDEKYTRIAWPGDGGRSAEALIRTPLKDLVSQLDPQSFVQVHRGVVVNLRSIAHVIRGDNETASIHLKGRGEILPVSRSYLHLFRQM
jgi:DNA-binding LytR/AlgR family response regulator